MNMQSCGNKMNLFDSLNSARRLTELAGAVLERSKRYPQRFALKTTPPVTGIREIMPLSNFQFPEISVPSGSSSTSTTENPAGYSAEASCDIEQITPLSGVMQSLYFLVNNGRDS